MTAELQAATLRVEMLVESSASNTAKEAHPSIGIEEKLNRDSYTNLESVRKVRKEPTVRILVLVEGTPECETPIPLAQQLARAVDAEICLLRVVEVVGAFRPLGPEPRIVRMMDDAAKYLSELESRFELPEDRTRHLVRWSDDIASEISAIAENEGIDLIVMASHCRNWLQRLTQVSVFSEVMRAGVCPVLCVPVPRAEASRQHRAMAATRS